MMGVPQLVSVLMGTCKGRKPLLKQAVKYFHRQDYNPKELLIVDDDPEPGDLSFIDHPAVKYIHLDRPARIGEKMNVAVKASKADHFIKLDDDDWHSPKLVSALMTELYEEDPKASLIGHRYFPVFMLEDWTVKEPERVRTGAAVCFHRRIWSRRQFREDTQVEDTYFFNDHKDDARNEDLHDPSLLVMVRHGIGHLWTVRDSRSHMELLRESRDYGKKIEELIPAEDVEFYRNLRGRLWPEKAAIASA